MSKDNCLQSLFRAQIFLERISFILTWLTTVLIKYNLNNLQRFILMQCWEFRSLFSCPYYLGQNKIMQGKQLTASLWTRSTDKDWKHTTSLKTIALKIEHLSKAPSPKGFHVVLKPSLPLRLQFKPLVDILHPNYITNIRC